jgi:hypothetical protein
MEFISVVPDSCSADMMNATEDEYFMNISKMQVSRMYPPILSQLMKSICDYEDINNCNENGLQYARNSKSNLCF